jgi:uncharacterized protein with GYD domain
MIEFLLLVNYRKEGARAIQERPDLQETTGQLCRSCGVELKEFKLILGSYHVLLCCETNDTRSISRLVRTWKAKEEVEIEVLLVFPRDEYLRLLSAPQSVPETV